MAPIPPQVHLARSPPGPRAASPSPRSPSGLASPGRALARAMPPCQPLGALLRQPLASTLRGALTKPCQLGSRVDAAAPGAAWPASCQPPTAAHASRAFGVPGWSWWLGYGVWGAVPLQARLGVSASTGLRVGTSAPFPWGRPARRLSGEPCGAHEPGLVPAPRPGLRAPRLQPPGPEPPPTLPSNGANSTAEPGPRGFAWLGGEQTLASPLGAAPWPWRAAPSPAGGAPCPRGASTLETGAAPGVGSLPQPGGGRDLF